MLSVVWSLLLFAPTFRMSALLPNLSDEFSCAICLALFQSPVTLLCGHSFCRACLQRMADLNNELEEDESVTAGPVCPACRSVELPADPTSLPLNTALASATEALRCADALRCVCDDTHHLALWYCLTCDAHACDKQAILAKGVHRGHDLDEQPRVEAASRARAKIVEAGRLEKLAACHSQNVRIDAAFTGFCSRVSTVTVRAGTVGSEHSTHLQAELEDTIACRREEVKRPWQAHVTSLDALGMRLRTLVDALPRLDGQCTRLHPRRPSTQIRHLVQPQAITRYWTAMPHDSPQRSVSRS